MIKILKTHKCIKNVDAVLIATEASALTPGNALAFYDPDGILDFIYFPSTKLAVLHACDTGTCSFYRTSDIIEYSSSEDGVPFKPENITCIPANDAGMQVIFWIENFIKI